VRHHPLDPGAQAAPDLIEPVIGYRQWRLRGDALWSVYLDMPWCRGVNTARCASAAGDHDEAAPAHACTCGIYAWYRPCPRLGSAAPHLVAGAVVLWGAMELHPTGMRAEHAMVVGLALPLTSGAKRRRVTAAASALEVPAVPARQLAAAALACGRPLPRALVPSASPRRRSARR
jgi:hypothetical protein